MRTTTAMLILLVAILITLAQPSTLPSSDAAAKDVPAATPVVPSTVQATIEAGESGESVPTTDPTEAATATAMATTEPSPTPELPAPLTPTPEATADGTPHSNEPTVDAPVAATPGGATSLPAATATPTFEAADAELAATEEVALTLTVDSEEVSFGRVSATAELDPAIAGLSSAADERGAYYVLTGAVAVTVSAGAPWTGNCRAEENTGTASTVAIAGDRLEWRLAGTATWSAFSPNRPDPGCFPRPDLGTQTFVYDLRLRVEADDPPGTFRTVLVFEAAP
jgi:hypothetical protein